MSNAKTNKANKMEWESNRPVRARLVLQTKDDDYDWVTEREATVEDIQAALESLGILGWGPVGQVSGETKEGK